MNCEIIGTMTKLDWASWFLLMGLGVWKLIDLIHMTPKLVDKFIQWVEKT